MAAAAMALACVLGGCGGADEPAAAPYATDAVSVTFRQETVGDRAAVRGDADFVTMSTEGRLVVYAADRARAETAIRAALDRVAEIAAALNRYDPSSELSAINAAAGGAPLEVSSTTGRAIEAARHWWQASDGAFNPLVGPLVVLWKEAARAGVEPSDEAVEAARALLDMSALDCEPLADGRYRVRLPQAGMQLDLGGLAKGWAAEEAVAAARRTEDPHSVLVMLGGDGTVWSEPGWPRKWTVAVQDPRDAGSRTVLTKIELANGSVVTSGDYYRYLEVNGRRLSHIIDPGTGRPTTGRLAGATVIHPDGGGADALATACMVLGPDEALALLARTAGADGLMLSLSGEALVRHETAGFAACEIGP